MLSWLHTITRRSPNTARCNLILNKAPHRSSGVKFVHIQLQMLAPISVRWSVFTISMTNDHHDNAMVTDGGINHMGNKSPPRHTPPHLHHSFQLTRSPLFLWMPTQLLSLHPPLLNLSISNMLSTFCWFFSVCVCVSLLSPHPTHSFFLVIHISPGLLTPL